MKFSETALIRFVKNFTNYCIDKNRMPANGESTSMYGLQFLYYSPNQLENSTYKKYKLDKNKPCFFVYSTHSAKTIFNTQDLDKSSICDMYEVSSNHLDTIN